MMITKAKTLCNCPEVYDAANINIQSKSAHIQTYPDSISPYTVLWYVNYKMIDGEQQTKLTKSW